MSFVFAQAQSIDLNKQRLTSKEIIQTGIDHNVHAKSLIRCYRENSGNLWGCYNQLPFSVEDLKFGETIAKKTTPQSQIDSYINTLGIKASLQEGRDLLNKNLHYKEFSAELAKLENKALSTHKGLAQEAVLVYLSVMKNSAFLWLPKNKGGEGYGYDFLTEIHAQEADPTPVIAADAEGAAGALIIGAFAAPATFTIAGFFIPVVASAAVSSVMQAVKDAKK